ncbi:hypothetical protein [Streptomyces bottropensis]|uniref:hypothetical protein n=1 Tax=Streptomyces bottropensis TaxID=42235 RepID=UPI00369EBDAB
MRLVFVHGRAQGKSSSEEIETSWLRALRRGCRRAGVDLPDPLDIRAPFYAKDLDEDTAAGPPRAVVRGSRDTPDPFEEELILDIARRAGITNAEITAELNEPVVARAPENWQWVQAAGRLICRKVPFITASFIRQFTADVHAYLMFPDMRETVNALVSEELGDGPAVLVSHSLGTVVSYCVLLESKCDVPLFVTLGSPLGIPTIKDALPRLTKPPSVNQWLNAADRRDPIALFQRLDRDNFPAKIENVDDIKNPRSNPHGILGYLRDQYVSEKVANSLTV